MWNSLDNRRQSSNTLWQAIESRYIEMKERRRRVAQSHQTSDTTERSAEQKEIVIRGFSAQQLEDMLKSSTRLVAKELVACLSDEKGRGVLSEIIRLLS